MLRNIPGGMNPTFPVDSMTAFTFEVVSKLSAELYNNKSGIHILLEDTLIFVILPYSSGFHSKL